MAGTINFVAGAAEVLPPPVGPSANRSGTQHAERRGAPDGSIPGQSTEGSRGQSAQAARVFATADARGQNAGLSNKTTLIFERDGDNGRMYLYIRDKRTGEEVMRIPSKVLDDAEPQPSPNCRVDIRV